MKAFPILAMFLSTTTFAEPLKLNQVLRLTEANSHMVTAALAHEKASESAITIANSYYYPTLEAQAIDSTGFPGSTSALGIGGAVGSPYRSGLAFGLLAKATVWDFGRTANGVAASEHDRLGEEQKTRIKVIDLDNQAARLFFECVRFSSQAVTWSFVLEQAKLVTHEVKQFVSTGQRTVVERYLAESQEQEAATSQADFAERAAGTRSRLQLYTGLPNPTECPTAQNLSTGNGLPESAPAANPWIRNAEEEAKAAEARLGQARAGHLPQIGVLGSVAYLDAARLVQKKNYAIGVGISLPLFEGFRTTARVQEAQALVTEKEALIEANREEVDRTSSRFDELLASAKLRLQHLVEETKLATSGFELARKRYKALQGPIIDVREALRNLTRVRTQLSEAEVDYWAAAAAKALYLGARKVPIGL
jgi:outer membrane protein